MKKKFNCLFLLLPFCLNLQAKGQKDYVVHYDVIVQNVISETGDANPKALEIKEVVGAGNNAGMVFCGDESLAMNWMISEESIEYVLQNKTAQPLTINADEVLYCGADGLDNSFGNSFLTSTDGTSVVVESDSSFIGYWTPVQQDASAESLQKPIIPNVFSSAREARKMSATHVGEETTIHLPVYVGSTRRVYTITFAVKGVNSINSRNKDAVDASSATGKKSVVHKLTHPEDYDIHHDLRYYRDIMTSW